MGMGWFSVDREGLIARAPIRPHTIAWVPMELVPNHRYRITPVTQNQTTDTTRFLITFNTQLPTRSPWITNPCSYY